MKLSIVAPAHNEEGRIGLLLDAYPPYFAERRVRRQNRFARGS